VLWDVSAQLVLISLIYNFCNQIVHNDFGFYSIYDGVAPVVAAVLILALLIVLLYSKRVRETTVLYYITIGFYSLGFALILLLSNFGYYYYYYPYYS